MLLPLLALLCTVYIYMLFVRAPEETPGATAPYNRIVIPPDSKESFDQVVGRLRSSDRWSHTPEDVMFQSTTQGDDDFFMAELEPRGPHAPGRASEPLEPLEPSGKYDCRSGFVTFKSEYTYKYLWTHAIERDGWLSASASTHTPVCLRAFEVKPVGESCAEGDGYVTLKAVDTGKIVRGAGGDEDYPWIVSTEDDTAISTAHHFLLEQEGFIYHKGAKAVVNVMMSEHAPIRLHANFVSPPQPADRDHTAAFQIEWLHEDEIDRCKTRLDKEKTSDEEQDKKLIERIQQFPTSEERRYISFGLYGTDPKYTQGAVRNAELAPIYFPGWKLRYYVRDDVPKPIIDKLKSFAHVEVVHGQDDIDGAAAGMFWRFTIADDKQVDRFIVRDVDSRLNARDRFAVQEWIDSGRGVHIIRDHVNHCIAMNGGMWGAKRGAVKHMLRKILEWQDTHSYGADLSFLQVMVWPDIVQDQLAHDSYCCLGFPDTKGFPTRRPFNYLHVGQVFDAQDRPRISDIEGFIRGVETPPACRRKPQWKYG